MAYEINYPQMIDEALHGVVKNVLGLVSKKGLKDGHHFFISFLTDSPGVELSKNVKAKYPDEITIVVQYQFEDLKVFDDHFSIKLKFDGVEEKVVVPYKAMTAFADPVEKISLQFHYSQENPEANFEYEDVVRDEMDSDPFSSGDTIETSNVIQLDKFRPSNK